MQQMLKITRDLKMLITKWNENSIPNAGTIFKNYRVIIKESMSDFANTWIERY